MSTEHGEPPRGGDEPRTPDGSARERDAAGRRAMAGELRAFAAELVASEASAARARDAGIQAMVDERLAAAERSLNATVTTRLDAALSELARDRRSMLSEWGDRAARAAEVEARIELTLARLLQGVLRIDGWMVAIGASERRMLDAHARLGGIERSVAEWAGLARRAADWEGRISRATAAEAEAARRIVDAERRLRDQL